MAGRLQDKIAIITGAAGGIGRATAQRFVDEGAQVMLVDLDESALRDVAGGLPRASVGWCAADVSNEQDAARYVARTVERFGGVDVLFDNAGIEGKVAPLTDQTEADFLRVMAVNVVGVWLGIKYAAPVMQRRGGGSIVITSSVAGVVGSAGLGPYVTSKHAVIGLMRTAAVELAPHGIRVNTLNPGPVDNRMMRSIEEQLQPGHGADVKAGFSQMVPLGRYGTNAEVASLALFLASDDSSYCTGNVYMVDGGFVTG